MIFNRSVVLLIDFLLIMFFLFSIITFLKKGSTTLPPKTSTTPPSYLKTKVDFFYETVTTHQEEQKVIITSNNEVEHRTDNKLEMKIHYAISKHDRFVDAMVHKSEKEYQSEGLKRINDQINEIQHDNSDELPAHSFFNTTDGSEICQNLDSARCVPKLQRSKSMFYAMMCYLLNPNKFLASGRLIHTELNNEGGFCRDGNFFWTYEMEKVSAQNFSKTIDDLMVDWKPFVFVRDPVDRILSAYTDKCLRDLRRPIPGTEMCNGCGKNITCFLMREYDRMIKSYGWNPSTFEDLHFFPQNWECNFAQFINKYQIVHYDSANATDSIKQLIGLLNERNIDPKYVEHIEQDLNAGRTQHKTIDSKARQFLENRVRNSPFLMEFIVRMYYWDFQLFNYPIPEINFVN